MGCGHGRPGKKGGHGGGEVERSGRFLVPSASTAISSATAATAVAPAAATVVTPVVPAPVAATEEAIVAGAGARVGPVPPPTAVAATT